MHMTANCHAVGVGVDVNVRAFVVVHSCWRFTKLVRNSHPGIYFQMPRNVGGTVTSRDLSE